MFLKKLLGSNNDGRQEKGKNDKAIPPQGVQTMGVNLQRKFAKGVQYNMKIVLKGDRNVGKSCLFYRLQGQKFKEEYLPTEEIQATSIQWNYKATDDIVKVEVWDVVDRGKRKKTDGLKLDTHLDMPPSTSDPWAEGGVIKSPSQQEPAAGTADDPCLDAEFLDVYKGTHGVIMMFDVTKQWTFSYVEREVPKVPCHIPVLVLANHRDMGHHRTVSEDSVRYFIDEQRQGEDGADIRYAESSMRNGYGLKYIHKFFNLPFLQLQRETLLRQLKTNSRERELTIEELNLQEGSEDQNYELYLEALTAKKHDQEKMERCPSDRSLSDQSSTAAISTEPMPNGRAAVSPTGLRQAPPPHTIPGLMVTTPTSPVAPPSGCPTPNLASPSGVASKSAPGTPVAPQQDQKTGGFMSRLFGSKNKEREKKEQEQQQQQQQQQVAAAESALSQTSIKDVNDFVPLDQLDSSFLDDATEVKENKETGGLDSDSDEESTSNPLVAGFQDDIDSDDQQSPRSAAATVNSAHLELSSDEEEEVTKSSSAIVTSSRDSVSDSISSMPSSSRSDIQLPIQWPQGGSTSHDNDSSRLSDIHAKDNSREQDLSSHHGNTSARDVSVDSDKSDSDSDDANIVATVTVLQDVISDDDEVTAVTDKSIEDVTPTQQHTQDAGDSPSQSLPTLQFQDFAVLDRDFDDPTCRPGVESLSDMTASSSRTGSDMESGTGSRKKKKHKSKDKDGERERKKKHKKHREKGEKVEKEGEDEGKKKRKSKPQPVDNELDELEAFLGPAGDSQPATKTSDYEIL